MARYDVPHQTYDSDLCYDEEEPLSPTITPAGIKKAMASNPVPENRNRAWSLAEDIADGLKTHEQSVGVKQNTQAVFRATLTQEQTAFDGYGVTKSGLSTAYTGLQIADSNAKAYLGHVRLVLVKRYGQRWTTQWAQTRFAHPPANVPHPSGLAGARLCPKDQPQRRGEEPGHGQGADVLRLVLRTPPRSAKCACGPAGLGQDSRLC